MHAVERHLLGCVDTSTECVFAVLQMDLFGDFHHSRSLLTVLLQLDKQRLLSWAATQHAPAEQQPASPLSTPQLYALFELLGYSHYLDDAELCAAGVTLLEQAEWALECGGVPYAGMFRLLAHQGADVRAKVGADKYRSSQACKNSHAATSTAR
jgi:hypothetical protein